MNDRIGGVALDDMPDDSARHQLLRFREHAEQQEGVIALGESGGDVVVAYNFGREADDSDMAGGAAYGLAQTVAAALAQAADECGLPEADQ